jgi:hypothetical protein
LLAGLALSCAPRATRAKEGQLKQTVYSLDTAIDEYAFDRGRRRRVSTTWLGLKKANPRLLTRAAQKHGSMFAAAYRAVTVRERSPQCRFQHQRLGQIAKPLQRPNWRK